MKLENLFAQLKAPKLFRDGVIAHIALIGNSPPRHCGISTYTADTRSALIAHPNAPTVDLYAMDDGGVTGYSDDIAMLIGDQDYGAYLEAADRINASSAQLAWIQHEFGIFGGESGSHLLGLVNRLSVPIVLTLHTVLEKPNPAQQRILKSLLDRAALVIVMTEAARAILERGYSASNCPVVVIPHGAPDRPRRDPSAVRLALALEARPTILTFGLLAPDKGIADMIEAMPTICQAHPDAHYVVLGATHPHLIAREGEVYRECLELRVKQLGLSDNVTLVNTFVDLDELLDWLAAADIYVTPYHNPAQATSGTLSYAVALGKAVVSTPYVHAVELLADGHGCLVSFKNPQQLATSITHLLNFPAERQAMAERAYQRGRRTIWSCNADAALSAVAESLSKIAVTGPPTLSLAALHTGPIERMTDDTGIFQHSIGMVPDRRHGYCIDDNARGLLLMAEAVDLPLALRTRLSNIYASFVQHAWHEDAATFRNFMSYDRFWLEDRGSEDSNGRTIWSLAVAATKAPTPGLRLWATKWFDTTLKSIAECHSPRACAFVMLGAATMAAVRPDDPKLCAILSDGGVRLIDLLTRSRRPDWSWFEIVLSYDNTRLPEALIRAGLVLGNEDFITTGLESLDWIANQTTGYNGQYQPVGTTSFGVPFAKPALFDQQPLEAWAMIDACAVAFSVTRDNIWLVRAEAAHDWFLGGNALSLPLLDSLSGECADGLTPFEININNGAESVIAWQAGHRAYRRLMGSVSPRLELTDVMGDH